MKKFFKVLSYIFGFGIVAAILYGLWRKAKESVTFAICLGILAGVFTLNIYLWRKYWTRPIINSVIAFGIVLAVVCVSMFAFRTESTLESLNTLNIQSHYYIDRGLFVNKAYMEYQIIPTALTEADKSYQVTIGNNIVSWSDKMAWSELELAISKPLVFRHEINQDEYTGLNMSSVLNKNIRSVGKEHNIVYLILPLLYGGLAGYFLRRKNKIGVFHEVTVGA